MDLAAVEEALRTAGWEVLRSADGNEIAARRDQPEEAAAGVWSLTVDHSGRLRLTVTAPLQPPRYSGAERAGRVYRVRCEQQQVVTVQAALAQAEELPAVLHELRALVREATG
ncbi:MAG: hypothetical protein NZ528_11400 [Caldilineales bacterium]|nr:hypothetical protein [Caldilineales bacterium]